MADENDLYLEWQNMTPEQRKATGHRSVEAYVLARLGEITERYLDWGD